MRSLLKIPLDKLSFILDNSPVFNGELLEKKVIFSSDELFYVAVMAGGFCFIYGGLKLLKFGL